MGLTKEEQAELDQLKAEVSNPKSSGLTPEEQAELDQLKQEVSFPGSGLIKGAIETLPMVGAIGGGLVGLPLGPVGAAGGAGLGGAAGKSLENFLEGQFLKEPKTKEQILVEPLVEGGISAAGEGIVAPIVSKALGGLGKAAGYLSDLTKPAEKEFVTASAERLGIQPTTGMKSAGTFLPDLEKSISLSPTLPGKMVERETEKAFEGAVKAVEPLKQMASTGERIGEGSAIKDSLIKSIKEKQDFVSGLYNQLEEPLLQANIDKNVVSSQLKKLEEMGPFKTTEGKKILKEFKSDIASRVKNIADLKEFRTELNKSLSKTASGLEEVRRDAKVKALTDIRNSILLRENPQAADLLTIADAENKNMLNDINEISRLFSSAKKEYGRSSAAIEDIQALADSDVGRKMANQKNYNELVKLKSKAPETFNMIKEANIREIVEDSMDIKNGRQFLNPFKVIKKFEDLEPMQQELIFGQDVIGVMSDLKTVLESFPKTFNPSGTAKGIAFTDMISPIQFTDFLRYGVLKAGEMPSTSFGNAASMLSASPRQIGTAAGQIMIRKAVPLSDDQIPGYISEVMNDKSLSVVEKAKLRQMANKEKMGVVSAPEAIAMPQQQKMVEPTLDAVSNMLRQNTGR